MEQNEKRKEEIKSILFSQNDEYLWAETSENRIGGPELKGPIPAKFKEISEKYNAIIPRYQSVLKFNTYDDVLYDTTFKSVEELPEKELKEIKKREAKREQFIKNVKADTKGKYDIPGKIKINLFKDTERREEKEGTVEIDITQREIAEIGLLPEDLGWKSLKEINKEDKKISSRDIAEADKETGLTTAEVGFFGRLINKIKEKFQGKGEK